MFIQFDPKTLTPIGATPVQPDENYVPITKEEWLKFIQNPSLFSQYEVVLQSDGRYTLEKAKEKNYSLKNRFFQVQRCNPGFIIGMDAALYITLNSVRFELYAHQRRFSGIQFYICKNGDPDQLFDTYTFEKAKQELPSDILERLDTNEVSVFSSFQYTDMRYGFCITL